MTHNEDKASNGDNFNNINLAKGLIFAHDAIGNNFVNIKKLHAQLYALIETLVSKEVIGLYEIEKRKQSIDQQMREQAGSHLNY